MTGSDPEGPYGQFVGRVDAVEEDLGRAAEGGARSGLTSPDEVSGERWDGGQVWAHMAEFVPYWIAESRKVLDVSAPEPVPFGRVKTDEGRIAAIERRRGESVAALAETVAGDVGSLRSFLDEVESQAGGWWRVGLHSKLGEMSVERIVDEFLVGHLEEHLAQFGELPGPG